MRRSSGFTLFELVLTMAILIIAGALAAPWMFNNLYTETKVKAGADMVRASFADCRASAIDEGRPYRLGVVVNGRKFKVEPYNGPLQNAGTAFLSSDTSSNVTGRVIEDMLPDGVRFGTKDQPVNTDGPEVDNAEYVTIAVFMPDGSAQSDAEIMLGAKGSSTMIIHLRAFTGSVTSIRSKEGP
jgi:hypothetical protein